jgi:hypothetical protein
VAFRDAYHIVDALDEDHSPTAQFQFHDWRLDN